MKVELSANTRNSTLEREVREVVDQYTPLRPQENASVSKEKKSYHINLVRGPSRAERVIPILVEYISDMDFKPGAKLPSEAELSDMVGVGIKSLREALQTLKMLGLLESRNGVGWAVTEFKPLVNIPTVLGPLLERFSRVTIQKVFEARLGLEPFIVGLAAKNITQAGLERVAQALEDMRKNSNKDLKEFLAADRRFHDTLAQECGNAVLILQNSLLSGLFQSMMRASPEVTTDDVLVDHEDMYMKVKAGDAEGAALVAKRYLELALQLIQKHDLR